MFSSKFVRRTGYVVGAIAVAAMLAAAASYARGGRYTLRACDNYDYYNQTKGHCNDRFTWSDPRSWASFWLRDGS